jgi:NAD(P)-dependent dehydrogenase (short-subunit alcohol dehydrogenase family)
VATARSLSGLQHLPHDHPRVLLVSLDVTSLPSITTAVETAVRHFGHIDVLINNAGINTFAPAETTPLARAEEIMDTNFWGPVKLTRLVLPLMRASSSATTNEGCRPLIATVSSMGGRLGAAAHATYCASKWAIEGWLESLKAELEHEWRIRLCLLEVGGVSTEYAVKSNTGGFDTLGGLYGADSKVARAVEYVTDPQHQNGWLSAGNVAGRVVKLFGGKDALPFRMVLGKDAYAAIAAADEEKRKELQDWMK